MELIGMYKTTRFAGLAASFIFAASSLMADYTLSGAIATARESSPDAQAAEARVAQARAVQQGADSAILPRIQVQSRYMQTNSAMNAFGAILNTGTFDNSIDFNSPGQTDLLSTGIYVVQPIYTGGRISSGRAAARAGSEAAEYARESALRALDLEVARAYFGIRQAADSVIALEAALTGYDESLRVAKEREEAGQLLRTERLNIEVQRARTKSMLLAARQQVDLAKSAFAVLLGLPAESPVTLAESDPQVESLREPPAGMASPEWPELAAMQSRVKAAEEGVKIAKAARRPSVGAFANVEDNRGWRRDGDEQSWTAGLSVSMTLYDGSETGAKIREAMAYVDEAKEQQRKLRLGLELRLRQAQINYDVARSQLEVCTQQLEQAEESAALSRERFSAGSLLSTELIGVETRLADARVQLAFSRARVSLALCELRNAYGLRIV